MANSNLKFAEEGLKIQASIADKMEELMATGGAIAISVPSVGTIIGAAVIVIGIIKKLGEADDDAAVIAALNQLQKQIDEIKIALNILDGRVDELIDQTANESNRQTLRDLLDYLDTFRVLETDLLDRPFDLDTAVRVANEAGVMVDKFLRNDFEIWRWTDVVLKEHFDPTTGQMRQENALSLLRFKNLPTLPVYITGLIVWLSAREKAINAGGRDRLSDDQSRLERHRAATAVRTNFDKYDDGDDGIPLSIAEHIKWRIRAYAVASTPYPRNRVCEFYFEVGSMMTGKSAPGAAFDLVVPPDVDTCFLDPNMIGSPSMEIDLETKAGVDTLYELSELLARLAAGGSLATPFVGVFSNIEVFAPATLYVIDQAADLQWYRNESASRRGASREWTGPKKVGSGWGSFTRVFNAGGAAIYAINLNGDLMWNAHDGYLDGTMSWRGDWKNVGNGWSGFRHVFSAGEYVVYGVLPDGGLLWYRHDGAPDGGDVTTWVGQTEVASGWQVFDKVFSGGDGVLYGIRPDGVLERREHKGYLAGTPDWEPAKEIGTGWQNFRDVIGAADGVIYAFTRDGRILWYRYAKRRPPLPPSQTPSDRLVDMVTERRGWSDVNRTTLGVEDMVTEQPSFSDDRRTTLGVEDLVTDQPSLSDDHRTTLGVEDLVTDQPSLSDDHRTTLGIEDMVTEGPMFSAEAMVWEGPVEIRRNFPAYRSVFALMNPPLRGPS